MDLLGDPWPFRGQGILAMMGKKLAGQKMNIRIKSKGTLNREVAITTFCHADSGVCNTFSNTDPKLVCSLGQELLKVARQRSLLIHSLEINVPQHNVLC